MIWPSIVAFDFSAVCPIGLNVTTAGTTYRARWDPEPSKLLLMSRSGQTQATHVCELNTVTHPESVYVRNAATGAVATLTQEQFKAMAE